MLNGATNSIVNHGLITSYTMIDGRAIILRHWR